MKKIAMSVALSLCLSLAAFAQTPSPSDPQSGSQGTVPSTSPSTSPAQTPDMNTGGQSQSGIQTGQSNNSMKGEKKVKGCIESQGGSYVLMDKHGKQIPLTGSQDLASHVGHTVTVHGTYGSGASSATSASSGSDSGQALSVTKVDMDSETCKMDKGNKKTGNMGDTTQSPK